MTHLLKFLTVHLVATAVAVAAVVLLGLEIIVAFAIGSLQGDESSIEIDVGIGGFGKNWFCIACNSSNVAANSRRVAILCRLQMLTRLAKKVGQLNFLL